MFRAWCWVALFLLSHSVAHAADAQPPVPASATISDLVHQHVERFQKVQELKARKSSLEREAAGGNAARAGGAAKGFTADHQVATKLGSQLESLAGQLNNKLRAAVSETSTNVAALRRDWEDVRTQLLEGEAALFDVRGKQRAASHLASLLSFDNRWFWLFSVLAVAVVAGACVYERRQEFRRLLNGGRARTLGLSRLLLGLLVVLIGLTLVAFLGGDWIYQKIVEVAAGQQDPRSMARQILDQLDQEIISLQEACAVSEQARQQATDGGGRSLAVELHPGLPAAWNTFRQELRQLGEKLAAQKAVAEQIQADAQQLEKIDQEVTTNTQAIASLHTWQQLIRFGLGATLFSLSLGGALLFSRIERQRSQTNANTCPLCLHVGTLQPKNAVQGSRGNVLQMLECDNRDCKFELPALHQAMSRLCFPTLGLPATGKTTWLAMTYRQLNHGKYPSYVQFERIKSRSSNEFDRYVKEILELRQALGGTQKEVIPHPLVFNLRDHDRLGSSNVLVTVFDYSGEVTREMTIDDARRQRALEADGYFFFLDPTLPSDEQADALNRFREDVRLIKRVQAGRSLCVPVALVLSKLDLMAEQAFARRMGKNSLTRFYEELRKIDPLQTTMSRQVIEARSELVARLRPTIWPGWEIEKTISDLFGDRFLYFPQTPYGLDDLGQRDLRNRMITPFAILEPLLWLLHMNGYPVLK